jgi:hypothetical protein
MSDTTVSTLLWTVVPVAIATIAVWLLAYLCARRRAALLFLICIAVLCGVASWMLGRHFHTTSLNPGRIPEWRHVLASFYFVAPFAVIPAAMTIAAVLGKSDRRWIPELSFAGACVALLISTYVMWMPACIAVRDCP